MCSNQSALGCIFSALHSPDCHPVPRTQAPLGVQWATESAWRSANYYNHHLCPTCLTNVKFLYGRYSTHMVRQSPQFHSMESRELTPITGDLPFMGTCGRIYLASEALPIMRNCPNALLGHTHLCADNVSKGGRGFP